MDRFKFHWAASVICVDDGDTKYGAGLDMLVANDETNRPADDLVLRSGWRMLSILRNDDKAAAADDGVEHIDVGRPPHSDEKFMMLPSTLPTSAAGIASSDFATTESSLTAT